MNMVSRAGNLSLPLANESSRQSDLAAGTPPSTDIRNAPKVFGSEIRLWWRGRNHFARKSAFKWLAMMQMRLSRPG